MLFRSPVPNDELDIISNMSEMMSHKGSLDLAPTADSRCPYQDGVNESMDRQATVVKDVMSAPALEKIDEVTAWHPKSVIIDPSLTEIDTNVVEYSVPFSDPDYLEPTRVPTVIAQMEITDSGVSEDLVSSALLANYTTTPQVEPDQWQAHPHTDSQTQPYKSQIQSDKSQTQPYKSQAQSDKSQAQSHSSEASSFDDLG